MLALYINLENMQIFCDIRKVLVPIDNSVHIILQYYYIMQMQKNSLKMINSNRTYDICIFVHNR